ncbi:ABC transporter permease subunit [Streptomyces lateritius]|uniref:ABC transporter permease subunit n=1 Tax=Streptomyces lateritius TaxID=67313 RepID=UPI001C8B3CCC|nr:ABC transporter permease subunit [Streptomyces lateritius]MBX9423887.1 ABC transporter permease [Streptomyces lateritius]
MSAFALRGQYWVTAHQHRRALWWSVALVAFAIAALVTSRLWSDSAVEALRAAGCTVDSPDRSCFQSARDYTDDQWIARDLIRYAALGMLVLPGLLGAFIAGPVIARELESGTYKLAWTQSISPARWLTAKVSMLSALVLTGVTLLSLVFYWSWSTGPANDFPTYWYEPMMFVSYGIVPVAHALLGLALGTVVGLLVRRTVVAMAAAALITGGAVAILARLRDGFWPVQTLTGHGLSPRGEVWQLERGMLTASGERLSWTDCYVTHPQNAARCMADRGGVVEFIDTHPASHYWPIQFVETGIVLALAALAAFAAFRVLRSRHP